jgi:tetratricopeptide (TPR) repeat protein
LPLVVCLALPARADTRYESSRQHFEEGMHAFDAHQYATAVEKFRQSYALAPFPELLVYIARCDEELHQVQDAIDNYERYLAVVPGPDVRESVFEQRRQVRERVTELRRQLATMPRPHSPAPIGNEPMARLSTLERIQRAKALFKSGQEHLARGQAHIEHRDYDQASREYDQSMHDFESSYALEPRPLLLFDVANVARVANLPRKAIDYFERYLASAGPNEAERAEAESWLSVLRRTLPPEPAPPVSAPAPVDNQLVAAPPPRPRPLVKRAWFWGVVGGAAAAVGLGLGLGLGLGSGQRDPSVTLGTVKAN